MPPSTGSGFAARIGESILRAWDSLFRPVSSLTNLSDAVAEGFGAVVWRLILTVTLVSIFTQVAAMHILSSKLIDNFFELDWGVATYSGRYALGVLVWLAAVGGAAIIICKDLDEKWTLLNWFFLAITAGSGFMRNGSTLAWLIIITGQAAIHYFIHTAAAVRRRRAEWLHAEARRLERGVKSKHSDLAATYRGIPGFEESPDDRPQ